MILFSTKKSFGQDTQMITDKSRDYYIGASDTQYVMSSFDGKTFKRFWDIKIGAEVNDFESIYTIAGNTYEQMILDELFIPYRNEQVIVGQLRVNLDGRSDQEIFEVKTHKNAFRLTKAYRQQVQVEMFAFGMKKATIIAYQLEEEDYEEIRPIDINRITMHPMEYDEAWVMNEYLPRLNYVIFCFNTDITPSDDGFEEWKLMKGDI